jgi:hypothetical protein
MMLPRIPQRTAPSHLGDLFFLPAIHPIPESLFPGCFFVRAGEGRSPIPAKKDKDRLAYATTFDRFSLLLFFPRFFPRNGDFFARNAFGARNAPSAVVAGEFILG